MGYKIFKTDSFQSDLDNALSFISVTLENKIAATSLLEQVEKC